MYLPLALALAVTHGSPAFELHHVYVAAGQGVHIVDPGNGRTRAMITAGIQDAVDAKFSPDGLRLYVLDKGRKVILVFDANHALVDTFTATNLIGPESMTIDPDGRIFVVDPLSARVFIFDPQGQVRDVAQNQFVRNPFGAALSRDMRTLYVSTTERSAGVHVFDLQTFPPDYRGILPGTDTLVKEARGLATDAAGMLYIVDRGDAGAVLHRYDTNFFTGQTFATGLLRPTYIQAAADVIRVTDPVPGPGTAAPTIRQYDYTGVELTGIGEDVGDPSGLDEYVGPVEPPTLSITGSCPGPLSVAISGLTPNGSVAIIGGAGIGGEYILVGVCAGTQTGLDGIFLVGGGLFTADVAGEIHKSPTAGSGICGTPIQVLDLGTCQVSNVDAI